MLDESILNLQITLFLVVGTFIFIGVCLKRKDLIRYLPTYILAPIGYLFIYLQIIDIFYRLLGNAIFLIANLTLLITIYHEYYKAIYKDKNSRNNKIILTFSMTTFLIISIQIIFSLLLLVAIIMLIKLYSIEKSTKHSSLIIFLSSALITAVATILSNFNLPGVWEFSFAGMFIFSTCYFAFPILIFLEEKLVTVGVKLTESEENFRVITEQSFIGALIEQNFDIKYVNPQFAKMIGYSTEELLLWKVPNFFEIIHPDDINKLTDLVDKKTKDLIQDIENFQFRIVKKTGEVIWFDFFSKSITYQDKPANLAFVMDITELKEVEEIIRKENKKLVELDTLRKELITRVSHELRTPLTTIYGASQILLQSNREDIIEKIWPFIEIYYKGSIRLKELVDNLLDASRLDNKKLEIRVSNVNLTSIIQDCIKELKYQADSREITIMDDLPTDSYFTIDKHRFTQVIVNIISNAIKNTPPHGKVFVKLSETIYYLDIIIQDTGVGITKEEENLLFQKFGKIERYGMNLDVDIEGVGLGLYISKEIVELHGGRILFESEGRNKGSTFTIRLNKKG